MENYVKHDGISYRRYLDLHPASEVVTQEVGSDGVQHVHLE